jgi:transposase
MTLIASRSHSGMGAAMILGGSTTAAAFEIYVEQILAPSLQAGQIVVMDNLRAHKRERVRQAIVAKGCQLLFATSLST